MLHPQTPWLAKSTRSGTHSRPHFRHELASALALLHMGASDLTVYLAACHHGKVRLSIRALPGETKPDAPDKKYARGIWEGDALPAADLGDGVVIPAMPLDLEPLLLGASTDGRQSWLERMIALRDRLGVFRLAYLESLIRAADVRASAQSTGGAVMLHDIVLNGCAPEPLIHYLKALGIFRLVAEQCDPQVRGAWRGDAFMLETAKTPDELIAFFLNEYRPTPIVAPWNGGSGFYPQGQESARDARSLMPYCIVPRLDDYRETVAAARTIVGKRTEQPKDAEKEEMLRHARRVFSDSAVQWLDAAYVLGESKPDYLPLLGSGGNDGRFEFTVNFVARFLDGTTGSHQAKS